MSDKNINDQGPEVDILASFTGDRVLKEVIIPIRARASSMIGWGIFCIVLGTLGLIYPFAFGAGVTIFLGAMFFVGGISAIALFWKAKGWKPRVSAIILAILTTLAGIIFMLDPIFGEETMVLFLAAYFLATGFVKAWVAFTNLKAKSWGLVLFSAIVSIVLGGCLWWQWPMSAPWIFGIVVAIELIFDGWTVLLIGLKVRDFNKKVAAKAATVAPKAPVGTPAPAAATAAPAPTAATAAPNVTTTTTTPAPGTNPGTTPPTTPSTGA